MKPELTKLATKFIKQAVMTEELDEVLQDTLNIISILERDFSRFRKKEETPDFSEIELLFRNLSEMEKELTHPYFLEEEIGQDKEVFGVLFDLREKATAIRHLVKGLTHRLFSATNNIDRDKLNAAANDLVYNLDRMTNMLDKRGEEHAFTEQDERSSDEISLDDLHPHAAEQPEFDDEDYDEQDEIDRGKILTDPAARAERLKKRYAPFRYNR